MKKIRCNFCGSDRYEERKIDYLYSYKGDYLLVPNTPVEVCLNCGMVYYDAAVLKEIERRFFAIRQNKEQPERYIRVPTGAAVRDLAQPQGGACAGCPHRPAAAGGGGGLITQYALRNKTQQEVCMTVQYHQWMDELCYHRREVKYGAT